MYTHTRKEKGTVLCPKGGDGSLSYVLQDREPSPVFPVFHKCCYSICRKHILLKYPNIAKYYLLIRLTIPVSEQGAPAHTPW